MAASFAISPREGALRARPVSTASAHRVVLAARSVLRGPIARETRASTRSARRSRPSPARARRSARRRKSAARASARARSFWATAAAEPAPRASWMTAVPPTAFASRVRPGRAVPGGPGGSHVQRASRRRPVVPRQAAGLSRVLLRRPDGLPRGEPSLRERARPGQVALQSGDGERPLYQGRRLQQRHVQRGQPPHCLRHLHLAPQIIAARSRRSLVRSPCRSRAAAHPRGPGPRSSPPSRRARRPSRPGRPAGALPGPRR